MPGRSPSAAMPPAPLPAPLRHARVATAACFFMNGALFATWVSRIPTVQAELGLSHGALGTALFGMALGALVAMPVAGALADRFGSRRVTSLAASCYFLVLPLLALAPGLGPLAVALAAFGVVHGALDIAMNAQAVAVDRRYPRPVMSSFHAFWSVGGLVGAGCGGLAAAAGISPLVHFGAAALLLGTAIVVLALPRLLGGDERKVEDGEASEERRGQRFSWPPPVLLGIGLVAFCIMLGEGAIADWSALFLHQSAGASESVAAAGFAAFCLAMAAARFAGDSLVQHCGPMRLVRWGSALAVAGLLLALLLRQPWAGLLGFAAVGAGFASTVPLVFSAAGRVPGTEPGKALAVASTLGYGGFLAGPPTIGLAADAIGLPAALGIVVLTTLVAIVLAGSLASPGVQPGRSGSGRKT